MRLLNDKVSIRFTVVVRLCGCCPNFFVNMTSYCYLVLVKEVFSIIGARPVFYALNKESIRHLKN